jgi:16S rRNA (cytosine967-C5)-methyltransferase
LCLKIIGEVEEGGLLDEIIDRHFSTEPVPPDYKPLIYEIASGVVRWKLYLDWVLSHFVKKGVKKDVRHLLRMSLYQAFFMKKAARRVVNEAVDYAKKERGQATANFVNAVLRRAIRERNELPMPDDPVSRLSIAHSFPDWLVRRWHARFAGRSLEALLALLNKSPEFALRIDSRRITREEAVSRLADRGVKAVKGRLLEGALLVDRLGPLLESGLLKDHVFHVQDETSQMAGLAVGPAPGDLVLDACAGRGTKTDQIKEERPSARVVAMDIDGKKLGAVRATACRLQADVLKSPFKKGCFDSILLDAPCSSLGIIRKHPEIKWRRSERDIQRYASLQLEMIGVLGENLKPGGRLIYSVCSFEPEETTDVVEKAKKTGLFAAEASVPYPGQDGAFLSLPHVSGMDGFFIAALRRL